MVVAFSCAAHGGKPTAMTVSTAATTSVAITTFHDEFGPQFLAVAAVGPSHEITTQGFAIEKVGGGVVAIRPVVSYSK